MDGEANTMRNSLADGDAIPTDGAIQDDGGCTQMKKNTNGK